MSKSRNRNSLLSSHGRSSYSNSAKDELIAMKYSMEKPSVPLYPLNDIDIQVETPNTKPPRTQEATYPDFNRWKDHTQISGDKQDQEHERLKNTSYLNKGYFEAPQVANEYYSARNLIQATIFSSTDNCNNVLRELSQHLVNAYKTRNEVINKIKFESNNFRIPHRVTLTASKKEAWLKELGNPNVPIQKIGEKIPHGIRNKVLIDSVCSRNVPLNRALWFTKCVLFGELIALRRKHQARASISGPTVSHSSEYNTPEKFEIHWLQEWTQQVADYVYKFSKEMLHVGAEDKKDHYMKKLNYLLTYVQSLYVENLLDKSFFLSLILKFLKDGLTLESKHVNELLSKNDSDEKMEDTWIHDIEINYGVRLVSITLVKMFWKDLIKVDYLCKELSELLLLNHVFISKISSYGSRKQNRLSLPENLKQNILNLIADTIIYLFKYNTNVFILPNYWILIQSSLYKIMLEDAESQPQKIQEEISNQLELIKYRNESLILNMKHIHIPTSDRHKHKRASFSNYNITAPYSSPSPGDLVEGDGIINRSSDDILRILNCLDKLQLNEEIAELLRPPSLNNTRKGCPSWRENLSLVLFWCITPYRNNKSSSEDILIVCNFLKKYVLGNLQGKANASIRAEFETEILETIYKIADSESFHSSKYDVYVLINELYQLKVMTIASYLRKLIASGIFYLAPGTEQDFHNFPEIVKTHLDILENLPVLNNKQCDSILKKWTPDGFNFRSKFDVGQKILQSEIIDRLINNDFDGNLENSLSYFKELNVGLKFLLVNWITNELRTTLIESTKLIHFDPMVIANLYQFYSQCDNLTVFFKVVMKTILKNEGGMSIFYLDSLYFMARLIMHHFKLIKSLAGTPNEISTTGYELFKLIIQNYKDLSSREYDYFKFNQVWSFIDNVIEKDYDSNNSNETSRPNTMKSTSLTSIFEKDIIDSPMKINTVEPSHTHITRNSDRYTSTDFRNDLEMLRNKPRPRLNGDELMEAVDALEIQTKDLSLQESVVVQLNYLYENSNNLSQEQENMLIKVLVSSRVALKSEGFTVFYQIVHQFCTDLIEQCEDPKKLGLFLKKLIVFEVLRISDFVNLAFRLLQETKIQSLIYEVLLGQDEIENSEFLSNQLLIMTIWRQNYQEKSAANFRKIISNGLLAGPLFSSELLTTYRVVVLKYIQQVLVSKTKVAFEEIFGRLRNENCVNLLNILLDRGENQYVRTMADLQDVAGEINEFNLPIYQILLRVITLKELQSVDMPEMKEKLETFTSNLLANLRFGFSIYNSFFGELFNYMAWKHKACILDIFETCFLTKTQLEEGDSLCIDSSGRDLLGCFNDFFKKFSSSSTKTVDTSADFFENLSGFLSKLMNLIKSDTLVKDSAESIAITISTFLRILIIHNSTLCKLLVGMTESQAKFVKNLIGLLNSGFLRKKDDKLRILLYDLLLLMKSSITDELTSTTETELQEATSPGISMSSHTLAMTPTALQSIPSPTKDKAGGHGDQSTSVSQHGSVISTGSILDLFDLPELKEHNRLKDALDESLVDCSIMLQEDELKYGGDVHIFNERGLVLIPSSNEATSFGILSNKEPARRKSIKFKSFEILEDTSSALNDGCVNLQWLDAYTTRENPP
ncbi:SRB8 [[Candida] subhashii]|uniref:Mediator of RNA polymerase II transcription subunit 12 n=1 Tax=[Candida] subhashii TaxID=561895 RepID=A0A8J5QM79_9ASCO|nr:SRB8 [[Candida] subhashii]KAG7664149.1 SRB8 [[Candida] subhashii]